MGAAGSFAGRASPRILSDRLSQRLGLKTSERELNKRSPAEHGSSGKSYQNVRTLEVIPEITRCMQRHTLLIWVVLPLWAVVQACIPSLHSTPENGYSNPALVVLLLVELHHIYAEAHAWSLAKDLLLPPELIVMRQLGILRKRPRMCPLGVLEVLDLYTDLVFPMLAITCEPGITRRWQQAWQVTPVVGNVLAKVVSVLLFWRAAALFVVAMLAASLYYIWRLTSEETLRSERLDQEGARVNAEDFFLLARYANMAMMPSIAILCEEMAEQRRWIFDSSADPAAMAEARQKQRLTRGYADRDTALVHELRNQEEQEKQENASRSYFTILLLYNVIISNCVQIYFQGTFFSLSFNDTGYQAKAKVLLGMAFSLIIAFFRCNSAASHLGCIGHIAMLFVFLFATWIALRMYNTFTCQSHVWNMTTGCVQEDI